MYIKGNINKKKIDIIRNKIKKGIFMKKFILIFVIFITSYLNGSILAQLKSWGNKNIEPDVKYNI